MIAIISDIHGNIQALDAVLNDMPPSVKDIWVLGDMIGVGASPCQVMDRLMGLPVPATFVLGNWEESLLAVRKGLYPEWRNWGGKYASLFWTFDKLEPRHIAFFEGLENTLQIGDTLLFHGRPNSSSGIIDSYENASEVAGEHDAKWLIGGHSHREGLYRVGDKQVVNAGSVGFSMTGTGGTACYALLGENIVFRHVAYDAEAAAAAMEASEMAEIDPDYVKENTSHLRKHHAS
jgi:predicted phosphodiesterase